MIKIVMVAFILLMAPACWAVEEGQSFLYFELTKDGKQVNSGRFIISDKIKNWSYGLQQSYLQLKCNKVDGKIVKSYSTADHFAGLVITHQSLGKKLALDLTYTTVIPRKTEIRAIKLNECQELLPIVKRFNSKFEVGLDDSKKSEKSLGEGYIFRYSVSR